jgi:hypothetical protein
LPRLFLEPFGDQRGLDRALAGEVLVERGRLDRQRVGDPPDGQDLAAFGRQQRARNVEDLALAGRWFVLANDVSQRRLMRLASQGLGVLPVGGVLCSA